ncbi:hypothetical protein PR048_015525 [Dryococelus australis]|uniref:Transposase n=1 Tax=Dryococelus australis TaxID=614101 RepID=A0ABQ9HHQ1_9NEOP|nr:hypothetical protein PR048_015525 [Dryococelus australis]
MVKFLLGPQGVLGTENEKRLVRNIQHLEKAGFAPTRKNIRSLAYKFADTLDYIIGSIQTLKWAISRTICSKKRRFEQRICWQVFQRLSEFYEEYDLFTKPGHVFNMDETGLQLNNFARKVIATKGSKDVHVGDLIAIAWNKAASVNTAVNGFRKTGVFQLDQDAIPEHFFSISDEMNSPTNTSINLSQSCDQKPTAGTSKGTPTKILPQISPLPAMKARESQQRKHATGNIFEFQMMKTTTTVAAVKMTMASCAAKTITKQRKK